MSSLQPGVSKSTNSITDNSHNFHQFEIPRSTMILQPEINYRMVVFMDVTERNRIIANDEKY